MPFGLELETFSNYALAQFQKRLGRLEAARGSSMAEVELAAIGFITTDDG